MENYGVPKHFFTDLERANQKKREIEEAINEVVLRNLSLKSGEIMRHKWNGLLYKVDRFNPYVNDGRVRITVIAYRYYQTGLRAGKTARSWSHLSFDELEKVKTE